MSDRELLSVDEALAMLPAGDDIHTFRNPAGGGMLLGADWSRTEIEKAIRESYRRELAGDLATRMKHGLVIAHDGALLFVATKSSDDCEHKRDETA